MKLASPTLQALCDTAIEAAQTAGEFIQGVDRESLSTDHKDAGSSPASQLVTEVDFRSEAIIRAYLDETCTRWDIAFVGEESSQHEGAGLEERLTRPYFWCVDPLDGTLPFVEGIPGYAVSIALVEQSGTPVIGVVFDPASGALMHAIQGQGAYRDTSALRPVIEAPGPLKVFADRSFETQADYGTVRRALEVCASESCLDGVEIIDGSGAVKNACQVLEYSAACYVKLPKPDKGGGSIWDFAATACIVREAGAWVSNIRGEALDLNRQDSTFMNHQGVVFASSERIAMSLIGALRP